MLILRIIIVALVVLCIVFIYFLVSNICALYSIRHKDEQYLYEQQQYARDFSGRRVHYDKETYDESSEDIKEEESFSEKLQKSYYEQHKESYRPNKKQTQYTDNRQGAKYKNDTYQKAKSKSSNTKSNEYNKQNASTKEQKKYSESLSILGFTSMPSEKDLKIRYRELVKRYHPDRGGDPEDFEKITEAYNFINKEFKD